MKFTVYGKIQGKARPRFTRQGRAYTPKQTADYERQIKQAYISAGGQLISDTAPIIVCITAEFKKAKSNKMQAPTLKPDTDNIAKIVCDALNGIAYHDDKQITSLTVDKVWADDGIEKVVVELKNSFIPDDRYGYKVDISDPKIKPLYDRFKKWKGIPSWCPLSDNERFEFERYITGDGEDDDK